MEKQIQGFRANFVAATQAGINTCDLIVAEEVECALSGSYYYQGINDNAPCEHTDPVPYTEQEFESLCGAVKETYLHYDDVKLDIIAQAAVSLFTDGMDIDQIDRWKIGSNI